MSGLTRADKFMAFLYLFAKKDLTHLDQGKIPIYQSRWIRLLEEKRTAIAAPRSFGKSTLLSIWYPLYLLLEEQVPEVCFV